jgi:hypothetical protein
MFSSLFGGCKTRPVIGCIGRVLLLQHSVNDDHFVQQFESCSFPFDQWHHRAHVKLAYIYLVRFGFDSASRKLREGIRAYNAANKVPDTPTRGYHETLTMFWLRVIQMSLQEYGPRATADEFFEFHTQLGEKKIHRLFYSSDLFMTARAKSEFVEPDLTSLPKGRGAAAP